MYAGVANSWDSQSDPEGRDKGWAGVLSIELSRVSDASIVGLSSIPGVNKGMFSIGLET